MNHVSLNEIDNAILQREILEGDTAIVKSFMLDKERRTPERFKEVNLDIAQRVKELKRGARVKKYLPSDPTSQPFQARSAEKKTD